MSINTRRYGWIGGGVPVNSAVWTCRRHLALVVVSLAVMMAGASRALAQEATIIGVVTDESRSVLPGVTVTATSPALQVQTVSAVTDARGEYRLSRLPIGTYTLRYEIAGFQAVRREDIRMTAGFVATIDISLKLGGVEETITVSGVSPVVDVTSTTPRSQFTRELLETLPTTGNSVVSVAIQAPGIRIPAQSFDVGGSQFTNTATFNNFGRSGDNWEQFDGVLIGLGYAGDYQDYRSFEEAQIQVVGNGAQTPGNGVFSSTIIKSGGNDFHGSGFYSLTGPWAQANNIDAALTAEGVTGTNKLVKRYDFNGDLGGQFIRDKLWFYQAVRRASDDTNVIGADLKPDGTLGDTPRNQSFWTTKLSYQMTKSQRLIGFYSGNWKYNIRAVGPFNTWESRFGQDQYGNIHKLEWQGVFGPSITASAKYGYSDYQDPNFGFGGLDHPTFDVATLKYGGDQTSLFTVPQNAQAYRYTGNATLSWYKRDFHGDHDIKFGLDATPSVQNWAYMPRASGDYVLRFRNGIPFQVQTTNAPVGGYSRTNFLGGYAQDNWTMRRLTLELGVRFDHNRGYTDQQSRPAGNFESPAGGSFVPAAVFAPVNLATWNGVFPRLHFAYDLTGHANTVVKGGWGRFGKIRFGGDVEAVNPYSLQQTIWTWHDNDGNKQWDPGEVNLSLTGPDFVSQSGGATRTPNPNELQPMTDEFSLSLEHEILPKVAIRVSGVVLRDFNLRAAQPVGRPFSSYSIPVTRPDPGPDGAIGTADDPGTLLTYYEYPAALRAASFGITTPVTEPGLRNITKALDVAITKRLSDHWQMLMSFSRIWRDYDLRTDLLQYDPNSLVSSSDHTNDWDVKAGGSYLFRRIGLTASANFNGVKGAPYFRSVLLTGGQTITSFAMPAEPFGAEHYPNAYMLDLRLEKSIRIQGPHQVLARIDLFNALNANTVTAANTQSGATYGLPTSILPARIAQFGFTYKF